jgi:hypothetical protein
MARQAAVAMSDPSWLPILGAVFSEGHRGGGLASAMRSQIFDPVGGMVDQIVHDGIAGGELRSGVSAEMVNEVIHGALVARSMLGEPLTDEWLVSLVDQLCDGFGAGRESGDDAASGPAATAHAASC